MIIHDHTHLFFAVLLLFFIFLFFLGGRGGGVILMSQQDTSIYLLTLLLSPFVTKKKNYTQVCLETHVHFLPSRDQVTVLGLAL